MERPYNIMGLTLKSDMAEKRHKSKPKHLNSVADGIERRLEENIKCRKSNRLTAFDAGRNFHLSPAAPLQPADVKLANRKLQLQKWKEEKEKTRKHEALNKKKPFLAGVYHAPMRFEPPPPLRVTRSQTSNTTKFAKEFKFTKTSIADKKKPDTVFTFGSLKVNIKKNVTNTLKDKTSKDTKARSTRSQTNTNTNKSANKKIKETAQQKSKTIQANKTKVEQKGKNNLKKIAPIKNVTATDSSNSKTGNSPTKIKKKNKITENLIRVKNIAEINSHNSKADTVQMKNKNRNVKTKINNKVITNKASESSSGAMETPPVQKTSRFASKIKYTPMVKKETSSSTSDTDMSTDNSSQMTESPIPNSESKKEIQLKSPKTPDEMYILDNLSPKVTMCRGKEGSLREKKQKLRDGLLADDSNDGQTVEHYRQQLASEITRINQLCHVWDELLQKETLPVFIEEKILAAVGLARLLVSQKLQQFASLIEKCAFPDPHTPLVTTADLRGFWDLVFIQIEDIEMKFKALDKYRERNWEEDVVEKKVQKKIVPKKTAGPKLAPASKLRDMIAAARKAKKQPEACTEEKTFEAGFFQIRSPVKQSPQLLATPKNRHSLLKAVVSSEAKKASANKNSYVMMLASLISKNVELNESSPVQRLSPDLPPIDLEATPARSILKNKSTKKNKSKKLTKTVLFNDDDDSETNDKENATPKKRNKLLQRQDAVCTPRTRLQRRASSETGKKPATRAKKNNDDLIDLDSPRVLRRSSRLSLKS